jgi:hypothetical protein
MRHVILLLVPVLLLVACGGAASSPEATATPLPFAQPAAGDTGASSSVFEREVPAVTTPGATSTPVEATPETSSASPAEAPAPEASGNATPDASALGGSFELIPVDGGPPDRPDFLHADLNLGLRGFARTSAPAQLVDYNGDTDKNAPKLYGLFGDDRVPSINNVYQVYTWIWDAKQCEGVLHGCRGAVDGGWEVTLAGFATSPGEPILIPERGPEVHPGGFVAMVLYAAENRITLGYTRTDSVAFGYAVHIENVCVHPSLLALYRAQTDENGWHVTGELPALRNNEALGTACGGEIQVAIRDNGAFMDPRSRKDWW